MTNAIYYIYSKSAMSTALVHCAAFGRALLHVGQLFLDVL